MNEYLDENFHIKLEDGIVKIIWLKEYYDYPTVDLGIKKRIEISGGHDGPMFSDFRKVKSGSREARERLAGKDAGTNVTAVAVLVSTEVHKVLFSFFNSIYKAPAPTKIFTSEEKALKWLEKYKIMSDDASEKR